MQDTTAAHFTDGDVCIVLGALAVDLAETAETAETADVNECVLVLPMTNSSASSLNRTLDCDRSDCRT